MTIGRSGILGLVVAAAFLVPAADSAAQACNGTPRGSGLAAEYGVLAEGNTYGAALHQAGSLMAFGLGYRRRDVAADYSGHEGFLRTGLVLGGKFQICPGIQLGFQRDTWQVGDGVTLNANHLAGSAGVSAGLEQRLIGDLALIPYAGARYVFNILAYQLDAGPDETNVTGDTLSNMHLDYGVMLGYGKVFGGYAVSMNLDTKRPYIGRFVLGLSFGGGRSSRTALVAASERRRR
ncbi:MAG: hypothetical protein FIB01_10350 [Gemmatimonadetes bacterium]|nr:hypothetical protein [Gemmatimonadota bacterium]